MVFTYRHSGRRSLLSTVAAVFGILVVVGVAMTTLLIAGAVAGTIWIVRAVLGAASARRRRPLDDHTIIEGVVVESTEIPQPTPPRLVG